MPAAQRDFGRLADFLVSKSPIAGERAKAAIWSAIRDLDEFSERGTPAAHSVEGMRELFVPFGRHAYVIQDVADVDQVTILRNFHSLEER
jgi:plasmid stabilization system protein ParE